MRQRDGTEIVAKQITPTANKTPFEKTSLAIGSYYIVFTFYSSETISTDAYLGKAQTENLTVVDDKTSTATITLTSFDAKKSVTYVTDKATDSSETVYYSRQSALATLKSDATKTNRTFVGWYRESNYSGENVSDPTDFDDGFDILSGESAVINNHASIDLSGEKYTDGTKKTLAGYTAGASGNMTLRVQLGAVNASSGKNLSSTKLIIALVDTSGGWYLTYIDGANFSESPATYSVTVAATSSQITDLHGYTIGGVFFPAGGYRTSPTATTNMTDYAYSLTGGSDALTTGLWKKSEYFTVRLIK